MARNRVLTVKEIEAEHKAIMLARELVEASNKDGKPIQSTSKLADENGKPLSEQAIRKLATRSRISVEKNLYIIPGYRGGSSVWRWHYTFETRGNDLSLGLYPDISLALARERAKEAQALLDKKIDPSAKRQADRKEQKEAAVRDHRIAKGLVVRDTFRDIAEKHVAAKYPNVGQRTWSPLTYEAKKHDLDKHLYPVLKNRPIADIKAPELLALFIEIQTRGTLGVMHRARLTAQGVFEHAKMLGKIEYNPCVGLTKGLTPYKPKGNPAPESAAALRGILLALDAYPGPWIVREAMRLHIMLMQRPNNVCRMRWDQIDWDNGVWVIPGAEMKGPEVDKATRPPHDVVLPRQALEILADLYPRTGHQEWVFPSTVKPHTNAPLSTHTLNMSLRVMGFQPGEYVSHGFRATAMTCGMEYLEIDERVLNAIQAHASGDALKKAYNRAQWRHKLSPVMGKYADWLDGVKAGHECAMHKAGELQFNEERAAMLSRIRRPNFRPTPVAPALSVVEKMGAEAPASKKAA